MTQDVDAFLCSSLLFLTVLCINISVLCNRLFGNLTLLCRVNIFQNDQIEDVVQQAFASPILSIMFFIPFGIVLSV